MDNLQIHLAQNGGDQEMYVNAAATSSFSQPEEKPGQNFHPVVLLCGEVSD